MITSVQNNRVKQWRKLHMKKERDMSNSFLIEGYHLIEEAWKSKRHIKEFIIREGTESPIFANGMNVTYVTKEVFQHISQTKTPQGIAAVVKMERETEVKGERVILLDQIQNPGNLGTIIRTADAAGFDAVVLGQGTVDLYNDKVIRATQGSLFHIPIIENDLIHVIDQLKQDQFTIWAAALEHSTSYKELPYPTKVAIIVGNEGSGIDETIIKEADEIVSIPIYGQAESLNVSIAAAILMYHLV